MSTMTSNEQMSVVAEKKIRKVNWTLNEIECLVDKVSQHHNVLFGAFSSTVTNNRKKLIWTEISKRVSACGSSQRSTEDVKNKWTTLKSDTRKKAGGQKRAMTQTGGGPPPSQLNDIEYKVVSLIPSVQLDGYTGGVESEELSDFGTTSVLVESSEAAVPSTSTATGIIDSAHMASSPQSLSTSSQPLIHLPTRKQNSTPDIVSRPVKKQKSKAQESSSPANEVLQLEREKVALMREHLQVDRERLQVESEILKELRLMREQAHQSDQICLSPIIRF